MNAIRLYRIKYMKHLVSSEDYNTRRADEMNDKIHYWKESKKTSNIQLVKKLCDVLIMMYLKRYTYYISGGMQTIQPLSPKEIAIIKNNLKN